MRMIVRREHVGKVIRLLESNPVVGILGARQVGKTTLAAQVATSLRRKVVRFDLEDSRDLDRLSDPLPALEHLRGLVILDEIQMRCHCRSENAPKSPGISAPVIIGEI